jgi:hypothetical protein
LIKPKAANNYIQPNKIEALESDYLYVKTSQIPDAGNGLFTAIEIYKNEIISLFKGKVITDKEAGKRASLNQDRYFINMLDGNIMDSMHTDCFAKYANDTSGLTNTRFKNNAEITLDDEENICLKATKNITSGEEIFCGYGKRYWKKHS